MVLDTVSIDSGSRYEGVTATNRLSTMAANGQQGLQNGYSNAAFDASGDDGDLPLALPGSTPVVDAAVSSVTGSPYRSSPKRNHIVPQVYVDGVMNGNVLAADQEQNKDSCGYCCWRPRCLQSLATGRFFVLFCSLLSLAEAGLTIGYISSIVTSIERNFNFSSTLTGFVVSCYDIGTLLVVFTSYYGGRPSANRPQWIALSAWVMSFGACIVPLSHFVTGNYAVHSSDNSTESLLCSDPGAAAAQPTEAPGGECQGSQEPVTTALAFLIPGMLLIGAGSTSMFALGTTYIDDYVRKNEAPILLAIFFCTTVIGPGVGFLVGFLVLGLYVDFNVVSSSSLSASDPEWLGAWWLGFFVCAAFIAVTAVPVYAFPGRLPKPDSDDEEPVKEAQADGSSIRSESDDSRQVLMTFSQVALKNLPRAVWSLLKNPIYMMVNVASAVEFSIVTGFVRFSPKFIEYQFNLSASTANLVTGTLVPVGAVGVVIGGIILNRVKRDLMTTINVLCIFTLTSGIMYGFVFIPGSCPTLPLAGVTTSYIYGDSNWQPPADPHNVNLTSSCNALCKCQEWDYNPICGSNGLTYFSACHAGCVQRHNLPPDVGFEGQRELVNYTNCSCIENFIPGASGNVPTGDANHAVRAHLQEHFRNEGVEVFYDGQTFTYAGESLEGGITGQCAQECSKLIPFICLLLVVVCVTSVVQMPALMTTLRSVKKEERPFALGLQFVIIRLFGYIPAPIYYGATIDSSCILWQRTCSDQRGSCLEYDNAQYFYRYLGLSTGLKVISVTMAIVCWFLVKRKYGEHLSAGGEGDASELGQQGDIGRSTTSLSTQLDNVTEDQFQGSRDGISVISNFKMVEGSSHTREPAMMNTVFS
ncbi:solute carrier organic anion transporter family member 5A1-like [Acanthaster planci]|uniref:Solute carrier organic anion transporter family member n=1 Tax=Acanthaster planci TaxID=133434 RepID=A0A8B7ZCP2_ACAPL|nr:solute carrier organic anion transporter family member 5A1-like [Acanthaster planci]